MTFGIGVLILFGLMLLAVPIGFALGIAGFVSLEMIVPTSLIQAIMSKVVHETSSSIVLLTIPMFILMAEFLSCGGVATELLLACNRALRKVRGGLAMACIAAGAIHAAATGSSTASAASLARASFPAMKLAGYSPGFSVGTIAITGTLALMIPPSVAFVIFGIITETSIGRLFLAGIIPGIMTALGYVLTISLTLKLKPNWGPSDADAERAAGEQRGGRVWPMFALIVIVLGGLYSGIATPTEIASIGAFGALVISFFDASAELAKLYPRNRRNPANYLDDHVSHHRGARLRLLYFVHENHRRTIGLDCRERDDPVPGGSVRGFDLPDIGNVHGSGRRLDPDRTDLDTADDGAWLRFGLVGCRHDQNRRDRTGNAAHGDGCVRNCLDNKNGP